jgi:hypothetical protein
MVLIHSVDFGFPSYDTKHFHRVPKDISELKTFKVDYFSLQGISVHFVFFCFTIAPL